MVVARFKAAGAIIVGHANMPDLANSDTNRSSSFGRTGNAYDVRFSPGGSSGGTVTAVAANMAVLGNGTDTGNSIRMPAATSALIGVFPTRGLVSIAGIAPLDWLLDNTGPIARTTTDAAIALGVMAGEDPLDLPDGGRAERCAASALRAVPPGPCPQGQTVRRAGVRSRRRWHSLPWDTAAGAGSGGREASRGREGAPPPRDACHVPGRGRGPSERRRRGDLRRPDPRPRASRRRQAAWPPTPTPRTARIAVSQHSAPASITRRRTI